VEHGSPVCFRMFRVRGDLPGNLVKQMAIPCVLGISRNRCGAPRAGVVREHSGPVDIPAVRPRAVSRFALAMRGLSWSYSSSLVPTAVQARHFERSRVRLQSSVRETSGPETFYERVVLGCATHFWAYPCLHRQSRRLCYDTRRPLAKYLLASRPISAQFTANLSFFRWRERGYISTRVPADQASF